MGGSFLSFRRNISVEPILLFGERQPGGFHAFVAVSGRFILSVGRKLGAVARVLSVVV